MNKEAGRARTRSGTERRRRQALLAVRMTPEEIALVRSTAERKGKTVSDYVRTLVVNAAG